MPNIFILGAPGYLGLPLSLALLRTGAHTIYGLARTPQRASLLLQNEIHPVLGDASDPSTWAPTLSEASIDIVIDCSSAYEFANTVLSTVVAEATRRRDILAAEGKVGPRMGFVYLSGTWVHGAPSRPESDLVPVGSKLASATPAKVTSWRPAHEQDVLGQRGMLDVAIVRPAVIYGRSSWIFDTFWGALREGVKEGREKAGVPLETGAAPNVVHVDDMADGLVRVVQRLGVLGEWPVFDFVAERVDMGVLMEEVKGVLGFRGEIEYVGSQGNVFSEAMSIRHNGEAERAKLVLEWVPRRTNMLMRIESVVKAWDAAQVAKETAAA
ncbi:MAG: hypothetical protein MMC23_007622 [Stictis urceolatum]|nr:hypothetical protein [Stictis urceolata]